MIRSFKHKGLERFFLKGIKSEIQAKHANRLKLISGRLNASTNPRNMDLPGLKLHELGGRRKGIWSVWVSCNWRVTFRIKGKDAEIADYEDYH
jgi:proteic killer suppression protein